MIADKVKSQGTDKRDLETYAIIGAAMNVHKELGHGFLEPVYQEALAIEMKKLDIPFQRECSIPIFYKGQKMDAVYRADFICFESVITELKAFSNMIGTEEAPVINCLKATGLKKSLLLNFGKPRLDYKRLILTK
jgi:GxxExxY protein